MAGIRLIVGRGTRPAPHRTPSVCVFCSASSAVSARQVEAARELGELIAARHCRLVYGAGGTGLMGAVAWEAARCGGAIVGVIPSFLHESGVNGVLPSQELVVTPDLFERKRYMMECADAYIALPGGYGTLDEVSDVIANAMLEREAGVPGAVVKPLILVDIEGAWAPFVSFITAMMSSGFARFGMGELFHVVRTPGEAMALLDCLVLDARSSDGRPLAADDDAAPSPPANTLLEILGVEAVGGIDGRSRSEPALMAAAT